MKALNRLRGIASILESTGDTHGGLLGALLVELAASIRNNVAEIDRGGETAPGDDGGGVRVD